MIKRITGFLLSLCAVTISYPLIASDRGLSPDTHQIIVRLRDDGVRRIQSVQRNAVVPNLRLPDGSPLTFVRTFDGNGMVVRLPEAVTYRQAEQLAAQLAADPAVLAAQADKRVYPDLIPVDPGYLPGNVLPPDNVLSGQWNLSDIDAGIRMQAGWDRETGSAGLVIAQLDTGIVTHRDIDPARVLPGYDFFTGGLSNLNTELDNDTILGDPVGRDPSPVDPGDVTVDNECEPGSFGENSSWHGLSVAGIMVAESDNQFDMAGIDFAARLLPLRVLGKCGGSISDVADAIRWAAGLTVTGVPVNPTPARVINLSLSGPGACSPEEQSAIDAALNAGAVVVVSAGNDGGSADNQSPANCSGVLTVGATLRDGSHAGYSNTGAAVTLSAPGGLTQAFGDPDGILVLSNNGATVQTTDTVIRIAGSSFSTAQVSAVASLMFAVDSTLSAGQVREILRRTTYDFPDTSCTTATCGSGILDADAALAGAADPASVLGAAVSGGGGSCSLATGPSRFDPLWLLLLLVAGVRYAVNSRRSRRNL
ncbi:MAG TPA: hypothetical protein ENJ80_06395 [Gammaproteobacteria bacterium]|nr:hypothetical protein [Gammaproteobacteria bacterium]